MKRLEEFKMLMTKPIIELENYYSRSTINIINFRNNMRYNKEKDETRIFQYEVEVEVVDKKVMKTYLPFTLYILDG